MSYFEKQLGNGTTIFGNTDLEGSSGYYHGHRGDDFFRSEHSTIGAAAVDAAFGNRPLGHTQAEHHTWRW